MMNLQTPATWTDGTIDEAIAAINRMGLVEAKKAFGTEWIEQIIRQSERRAEIRLVRGQYGESHDAAWYDSREEGEGFASPDLPVHAVDPSHSVHCPECKPTGGDMVQVGITKNGRPVQTWEEVDAACLAVQAGIEAFEVVDSNSGVYIVGMPDTLVERLMADRFLRIESNDAVFVIEAEMA